MPDTPLNPDALEAASRATDPESWGVLDAHRGDPVTERLRASLIAEATQTVTAYLAAAQPEVNSDTELHVGTLIEDKTGQRLWNVWRTGGPAVHWMDDEGRPATPVFPARILYRPEVNDA